MGASKGVLLSGIALIVGMYTVGIKKAEAIIASAAGTRVYQIQSEANARSGIRFAINYLDNPLVKWNEDKKYPIQNVIMMGDTIRYFVETNDDLPNIALVTSTSNFKGVKTTIRAEIQRIDFTYVVKKKVRRGYNWVITKTYVVPTTEANPAYY